MVIAQIFDVINLILNKQRRGFVKTSQKITAVKAAMYDFFHSQVEQYRKFQFIPAAVKQFAIPVNITLTDGVGNLPADFSQEITFRTSCGREGTFLTPEEFYDRVNSSILAPDQAHPIAKVMNDKVYVAPDEYSSIEMIYFRHPAPFVYATSVSGDGRTETFNQGGSTDTEFSYEYSNEIARRALAYLGVAFQNADALQIAVNDNGQTPAQ